MIKKTFEKD